MIEVSSISHKYRARACMFISRWDYSLCEKAKSLYLERLEETRINRRGAYLIFVIGASFILASVLLPDLLQFTQGISYNFSMIKFVTLFFGLLFCFLGSIEMSYYRRQQLQLIELLEIITVKDTQPHNSTRESSPAQSLL